MIYSKTCEHAIRALVYFADHPEKKRVSVKEVSDQTGVPQAYVAKIFQCLAHSRILDSRRGPTGGYSLRMEPRKLTLLSLVNALDDVSQSPFSNCVMGLDRCTDECPCPLHDIWVAAKEKMRLKLTQCTIADLAGLSEKFKYGRARRFRLSKKMREIFSVSL